MIKFKIDKIDVMQPLDRHEEIISCLTCNHFTGGCCHRQASFCLDTKLSEPPGWMFTEYSNWPRRDCRNYYNFWQPHPQRCKQLKGQLVRDMLPDELFEV